MKHFWVLLLTVIIAPSAWAEDYTLFNPVPDNKLRQMNTERPSRSDSAYTVDAGHYQFETSLLSYTYDTTCLAQACTKSREWDGGSGTMLRMGLTQSSEVQLLFDMYRDVILSDKTAGTQTHMRGIGDTTLRYKYNFLVNDGADVALAGMVFAKLPTNADHLGNNAVEGGVELPFQLNLNDGWSVSGMTQLNILNEQSSPARDYYIGYVNVVGLGKSLSDTTSTFVELYTFLPDTGNRKWQNTLDVGLARMLNSNLELDTAVNLGLTKATPDAQMQVGISYRF